MTVRKPAWLLGIKVATILSLAACGADRTGGDHLVRQAGPAITRPSRPVACPIPSILGVPSRVFDARSILGLTEAQATAAAARYGCVVRALQRDGHRSFHTLEGKTNRIDVDIVHGFVTTIEGVG